MLSYSGGLSQQQQKAERKRKSAAVHELYEEDFKKTIRALNAAIKSAQGSVKEELHRLRARIKEERKQWPDIWKGYQIEEQEKFERFVREARAARDEKVRVARAQCMQRGTTALKEAQEALLNLTADKASRLGDRRFSKQYEASKRKEPKKVSACQKA